MPITEAKGRKLTEGQQLWVRNNADGTWHPGKYEYKAGNGTIFLTECTFRWCHREDISLTDPHTRTVTLRVKETCTLDRMTATPLTRALQKAGYVVYGQSGKIVNVYRDVTVELNPGDDGDELEGKLRTAFSSVFVRTLAAHNNEPMESEGIDITNKEGDSVDLQRWAEPLPAVGSTVYVEPKEIDQLDEFSGTVVAHKPDGTVTVQDGDNTYNVDPDQLTAE